MLAYYLVACLLLFLSYRGQCFFRHLFNWPWFCQLHRWWQSPARYVVYFLSAPPCLFPFVFHLSIVFETLMLEKVDGRGRRGWQDEVIGWHHRHMDWSWSGLWEMGEGQGSLACRSPWGHKESDTTERLNNKCEFYLIGLPEVAESTWWFKSFFQSVPVLSNVKGEDQSACG